MTGADRIASNLLKSSVLPTNEFASNLYISFRQLDQPPNFLSTSRMYLWCSTVVTCRLYSCNCIKRELHYIRFTDNFPKFSAQLFQNALVKSSVTQFSRVVVCGLYSCLTLKSDSTSDNFLKFLEVRLSPQKCL